MTSTSDWARIEALFDAAWDLPESQRRDWLRAQAVPASWIDEALRWLDAASHSAHFLAPSNDAERGTADGDALTAGGRAGRWRVVRAIGRGGMGEVYEVVRVDGQFSQRAALKLLTHADATAWQRFQTERQILADLDHPGIARMIDGGLLAGGRPYMVMEYVDGLPIDTWCDRHGLDLPARVALIADVCAALAHAHGRLVVHRDLTPSNILVDSDGRARLIDFGVARLADETATNDLFAPLSLDYAAPEQAGSGQAVTATDVHGLAAVLYRLVAGCPPRECRGQLVPLALARIRNEWIPRLLAQPGVARWAGPRHRALLGDLDAIIDKALQRDPADRYATADALCRDLHAALDRGIVQARAQERGHRLARQAWKQRWALLAAAAIVASLAMGLVAALWQAREAATQRDHSLREQARLEAVQQSVFHMFRSAGELKGGGATAADVLDNAAQRIQDEFARDPSRGAPVLHALGELYFLITDYQAARPLLQRLADADPLLVDPALIAAGRYDLAQVLLREGDAATARELLALAQAFWNGDRSRWASRLVDSRLLESQLLKQAGQVDAAIAMLEDGLRQRIALSGPDHRESGIFHNNLGVALFGSGRFEQARESFRAASVVWKASGLEKTPDALNTLNNWGAVEMSDGKPDAAMPLLRDAVELRRRFFGASAATAALLGNYGKLLLQTGQATAALPVLREATAMGEQFAGNGSLHHVAAASGMVEAQLAIGEVADAERLATSALSAAKATLGGDHAGTAMASLALARIRSEQRRVGEAQRLLEDAERIADRISGSAGARLTVQATAIRERYQLPARRPVPDTTKPSP